MEEKIKSLNWENFKTHFHESWHKEMKEIIESEEMYNLYQFLKEESKKRKKLTPLPEDVFKAFQIDLNKMEVVVMGMDVYAQYNVGKPVANGIAMDCTNYGKLSPTLEKFYEGLNDDLYASSEEFTPSLSLQYLVDQNVLLTNAALTCEKDKSGKHIAKWRPFWTMVFDKIFSKKELIFVFLGEHASLYEKLMTPFAHYSFSIEHPVAASYQHRNWKHEYTFSKVNKLLKSQNLEEILWLKLEKSQNVV